MPNRLLIPILFFALASPAIAKDAKDTSLPRPALFDDLINCRNITDDSERLACYDGKVGALDEAQKNEEIIVTDREAVKQAKRGLFGFSIPKLKIFGSEGDDQLKELTSTVRSARVDRGGKWIIILEDGAKWKQVGSEYVRGHPKAGMGVRIRKASFGTYFVNVDGRRAIRMKRVN